MSEKLRKLEVNLQQSIIWTGREDVSNTICAITHKYRNLVVIRVEYVDIERQILAICGIENPNVIYGDSFRIDTWDRRINKYLEDACQAEEEPEIDDRLIECAGCGKTGPGDQLSANGLCPECVKAWIE